MDGHDERREVPRSGGSNTGPYALIALSVAFLGFGISVGIRSGVLVPVFVFMFPALVLAAVAIPKLQEQRQRSVPPRPDGERELLAAIRNNGGSITPAEAAMGTSLTVREADKMHSELAGGGHLAVEGRGGSLFYSLPARGAATLEGRE